MRIFIVLLILSLSLNSNDFNVKTKIDSYEYKIGDHINLELKAKLNKDFELLFPKFLDTTKKLEILSESKIDTTLENNQKYLKKSIKLICFDSGYYSIPKLTYVYRNKNSSELIPKLSNSIDFKVSSIAVDTSKAFKDINSIIEVPFSIYEYIIYFYIFIGILILAIVIYFIYNKYFKKKITEEIHPLLDPKIEPHILSLSALKKLKEKKLWQKGEFKEYYTEMTDILRIYIKRIYLIDASEKTTNELIHELKIRNQSDEIIKIFESIFVKADLVKFAKYEPLPNECEETFDFSVDFINKTTDLSKKSMLQDKIGEVENV